jgi:hypothetical protein
MMRATLALTIWQAPPACVLERANHIDLNEVDFRGIAAVFFREIVAKRS